MEVCFLKGVSHRDSSNQYKSNSVCRSANSRDDQIAYYRAKDQAVKELIQSVLKELSSKTLTKDKKKQLRETLTTATEYLDAHWFGSRDYYCLRDA